MTGEERVLTGGSQTACRLLRNVYGSKSRRLPGSRGYWAVLVHGNHTPVRITPPDPLS